MLRLLIFGLAFLALASCAPQKRAECGPEQIHEVDQCAKRAMVIGDRDFEPPSNLEELDAFCK